MGVFICLHVMILGAHLGKGEHSRQRRWYSRDSRKGSAVFFGLRKLCNDEHKVKIDAQKAIAGRLCDAFGGIMAASR